jgi:hypothetical protein
VFTHSQTRVCDRTAVERCGVRASAWLYGFYRGASRTGSDTCGRGRDARALSYSFVKVETKLVCPATKKCDSVKPSKIHEAMRHASLAADTIVCSSSCMKHRPPKKYVLCKIDQALQCFYKLAIVVIVRKFAGEPGVMRQVALVNLTVNLGGCKT